MSNPFEEILLKLDLIIKEISELKTHKNEPQLIPFKDFCKEYNISRQTGYQWIVRKLIQVERKGKRIYVIRDTISIEKKYQRLEPMYITKKDIEEVAKEMKGRIHKSLIK